MQSHRMMSGTINEGLNNFDKRQPSTTNLPKYIAQYFIIEAPDQEAYTRAETRIQNIHKFHVIQHVSCAQVTYHHSEYNVHSLYSESMPFGCMISLI